MQRLADARVAGPLGGVANVTREDVRQTLAAASETGLRPTVEILPLRLANQALARLSGASRLRGAMVLDVAGRE